jgi:hypothetical protein
MRPSDLLDDFTKNHRYGSIEFEYRAGELVFVRRKETLIPATHEKNSTVVPRRDDGTHERDFSKNY